MNVECYLGHTWTSASRLIRVKDISIGSEIHSQSLDNLTVPSSTELTKSVNKYRLIVDRLHPRDTFHLKNGVLRATQGNVFCHYPSAELVAKLRVHKYNGENPTKEEIFEVLARLVGLARWRSWHA